MKQLNDQQKNALWVLMNAIDGLHAVMDDELEEILEDQGFLPQRDMFEMSGELEVIVKNGEIGNRQESLEMEDENE